MRPLAPLVLALAACSPPQDTAALREELAALRQEVREVTAPKLEALDALTDLTKEVRGLRDRLTAAPPSPPGPGAVPIPLTMKAGDLLAAPGGTQSGINDLFWVLAKANVDGEERVVLCLYRAMANDRGFQLTDVRLLNYDFKIIELNAKGHLPSVNDIRKAVEKK